jgi:signal transduction histidine kinase
MAAETNESIQAITNKGSIRVLLIEDDEIDRRLVERLLTRCPQPLKFSIESSGTLSGAIEYLSKAKFDIIIADLGLPDSSGIETIRKINELKPNIAIVVLTGLDDEETGLLAIKNGAADYLVKGRELENVLVRTIRYAIERKLAEEKLKEAIEMKSEFISTVSHELRTPMTSIKEGISIVLEGAAGQINDDQKELLDIAKRNLDRLARLINDVLDFQKLQSGKVGFDMQNNNINEVIEEVYKAMLPPIKRNGLDLSLNFDNTLPRVKFDVDKIIQVLTNLINNAVKFTEKGQITIATSKLKNAIQVSVSDTGCGMKQEDLPKLFNKFGQLGKGGDRKTGGTGLGLAICKDIISRHNGKIWTESEPGKGSTFSFTLPTTDAPADNELEKQLTEPPD